MKPDGNGYQLSTGRTIYANQRIIGISADDIQDGVKYFPEGYDGSIDIDDWTREEKLELIDYVMGLWQTLREKINDEHRS